MRSKTEAGGSVRATVEAPEIAGEPPRLPPAQEAALKALLEGASVPSAAGQANVSPATVYRWKREDEAFREALEARLHELRDSFEDRRVVLISVALNTLHDVMVDAVDSRSRVRAAEIAYRFFGERVLNEERAAKLEATMQEFRDAGRGIIRQPDAPSSEF